ncbi:MAG: type II toxin-antitoxin system HicA family toxin [Chthoniobacteraceae bacterium]
MPKFPVDAPLERVLWAMGAVGFQVIRSGNHSALSRTEADGTRTPMTIPAHRNIKGSTLWTILTQSGIARDDFLRAYDEA